MSGGGRCNFTNMYTEPSNFLSQNPHFCKSALARYTQWDFIGMVGKHGVPYHEKKLGQLFCDNKSSDILEMLLDECDQVGVELHLDTSIQTIEKVESGYLLDTTLGQIAVPVAGDRHRRSVDPDPGRHRFRLSGRQTVRPRTAADPRRPGAVHHHRSAQGTVHRAVRHVGGLPGQLQRPELSREHPVHPPRPQRPGDFADLLVLGIRRHRGDQPAAGPRRAELAATASGRTPEQRTENPARRDLHQEDGQPAGGQLVRLQTDEAVHPRRTGARSPTSWAAGKSCRPAPKAIARPK